MRYLLLALCITTLSACRPAQDATPRLALKPCELPAQHRVLHLASKIDELSRPLVDADLAVGLVVGVLDGETSLVRGYGVTARDSKQTPNIDTTSEIGSVAKVFTGLLLADAVQAGKVALEDPVQKHLPEGVVMPKW